MIQHEFYMLIIYCVISISNIYKMCPKKTWLKSIRASLSIELNNEQSQM